MNNISTRLKFLRKKSKLNQEELAEKSGLKRSTIATIEANDKASLDSIETLSNYFGIEQNWLHYGTGTPPDGWIEQAGNSLFNPWRDATVTALKEEVNFLKEQVRELTAIVKMQRNFLKAIKSARTKVIKHDFRALNRVIAA